MQFLEKLREIERKWQKKWKENKVFEADPDSSKPKYFITVPYPYTSGPLHIGHGRTYTQGDIIARYKRLRGFNVLFPMASHVTGTPIFAISDSIRRGDKKTIELYKRYVSIYVKDEKEVEKIIESFKDPLNVAKFFAERIKEDFESLGYSIDWRRRFHTAEKIYNKFVEWQYKKMMEKGVITQGEHYVTYCLLHEQPVGEDDIKDGDVNPVEIVEFVGIKFEFEDGYIIACTLRPETIYGCTNMWVNPNGKYCKIKVGDEIWYVSKEAYEKIKYQFDNVELLEEMEGKYFVEKKCRTPLGKEIYILPAIFVDTDRASGFVYSEPSDAPYDYVALKEIKENPEKFGVKREIVEKIEPIKIIEVEGIEGHHAEKVVKEMGIESQTDPRLEEATEIVYKEQFYKGKMIVEELKGISVSEAREIVKERFLNENKAIIFRETSRKAVCRAGGKIIIARIKNQWFIDYSPEWWKEKTREWLKKMLIIPEKYRKLFFDTVDWLERRPCARKRGLGTRFPFDPEWIIESLSDSTIYMAFYTIAHHLRKIDPEKLTEEVFDYIFLGKGDPEEISKKTGIGKELLIKMRKEFDYWYPLDQRHTGIAHITNHLTFFVMHHILIFPEKYWPRAITLNELVIREGQKMSKSKGNVILLRDIAEKYSADLFRLYISWAADWDTVLDWKEKEVQSVLGKLMKFYRICMEAIESEGEASEKRINRWFISRFYRRLKRATEFIENFKVRDYIQEIFFNVLNDYDYLIERGGEKAVLKKILRDWIIALSPVIPHLCEEIWEKIGEGFVSLQRWPEVKFIDEEVEKEEEIIKRTTEDIRNIIEFLKKKGVEAKKIKIIVARDWKYKMLEKMKEKKREFKELMKAAMEFEEARKNASFIQKIVKEIVEEGFWEFLERERELKLFKEEKEYFKKKFNVEVEIEKEEESKEEKASKALPGKPAIVVC